jgi:hypothetical protein
MAGHSNTKATGLYDRRNDDISVGEADRIGTWPVGFTISARSARFGAPGAPEPEGHTCDKLDAVKPAVSAKTVLLVVAIMLIATSAARADLIASSGLYDQGTGQFYNVNTVSPLPYSPSLFDEQIGTFNLANPGTLLLSGAYAASSLATYGSLETMISVDVSGFDSFPLITEYASAFFFDTLTFNTGTAASSGTAYLSITMDGSGSVTGSNAGVYGNSYATVLAGEAGTNLNFQPLASVTNTSGQATVLSQPIPFMSGVPVNIEVALAANLYFGCHVTDTFDPVECGNWSASGVTDYSHTAILTGIELFDTAGAPINTFTISSASGTSYGPDGVTPEPCSFALCLGAVAVFGAIRYRKCTMRSVRA